MADATRTVQIILRVVDQSVAATKSVTTNLSKMRSVTNAINDSMMKQSKRLNVNNEYIKGMGKHFSNLHAPVKALSTDIKEVTKRARGFDMAMLGIMFGGMAITRMFGGMAKALQQTFIKAQDETSGLSQATLRLSAA